MRGSLKASISLTIISARLCIFGLGFDSIRAKNLPRGRNVKFYVKRACISAHLSQCMLQKS